MSEEMIEASVTALLPMGPQAAQAAPTLLLAWQDPRIGEHLRSRITRALAAIGVKDIQAVFRRERQQGAVEGGQVDEIVADEKSPYRGLAASSLGALRSASGLPELRLALSAPEKYTRILAAKALAALGSEATPAVPELIGLLKDPDPDIRLCAVETLGRIGPTAAAAVPQIERQLQFPDRRLKECAVTALELIGGTEAEAVLERDAHRYATVDLIEFKRLKQAKKYDELQRFVTGLPRARRIQLARVMLKDPDPTVSYTGADVLTREGLEEETVPTLSALLLKETSSSTGRLGYDLQTIDGGQLFSRMKRQICNYLETNLNSFSPEEQERIRKQLCPHP